MKTTTVWRWVGGKTRLLPDIKALLPPAEEVNNYFEVFCGGGALFFDYGWRCKGNKYLNDICQPLMATYSSLSNAEEFDVVQQELWDLLENSYEEIRTEFNHLRREDGGIHGLRGVALFIALNHLCFNGVWRENKNGGFNVPVGKNSKGEPRLLTTLDFDKLEVAGKKLEGAVITAKSFNPWPFLKGPGAGDVVFYDPPYLQEFSDYHKEGFCLELHKELAEQAKTWALHGTTVIVCGSNNEASWSVYGQPTKVIELQRTVGHSKRRKATEALYCFGANS
jgi:DNA adenine methylase